MSIPFLEASDFDFNQTPARFIYNEPVFVMVQSPSCPHCRNAKPAFESLASNQEFKSLANVAMVDLQGRSTQDQAVLSQRASAIFPIENGQSSFRGVPSYLFFKNNKVVVYNGDRSEQDMLNFCKVVARQL